MTIKEFHIEVQQSTQNIAANIRRKLLPEEIDWLLNKNQQRFIQARIKPKIEGNYRLESTDRDALRTLLQVKDIITTLQEDNQYAAPLPADYLYMISDSSRVMQLCNTMAPDTTDLEEDILCIPFPVTAKDSSPYYVSVILQLNANTIALGDVNTLYQGTYTGVSSKIETFSFLDTFLWYLRNIKNLEVYWERYSNIYKPRTFLFKNVTTGSITIDGTTTAGTIESLTNSYYDIEGDKWSANRLILQSNLNALLDTPYFKSSYISPISELSNHFLLVYGDDRFIVSKVRLEYIKKPRRMSLILGQDSELPEEYHQAVCDLTSEYIKAMIADPNWEVKLKDNMLRSVPNQ